jgi:hypothetical protein
MQLGTRHRLRDPSSTLMVTLFAVAISVSHLGCDQAAKRPILPAKQNSEAAASASEPRPKPITVAHPEYENWSRFPKGASITRSRTVTNEFGEVRVTTKMWLEDKNDREVSVGSQIHVVRSGDYPEEDNPPSFTKYPAAFQVPQGMTPEFFQKPSDKAKLVGKETVAIADREFEAELFEWTENNEAGPMKIKLWRSIDVPGRIVRQEMLTESSNTKTLEVISQLDLEGPGALPHAAPNRSDENTGAAESQSDSR